MSKSIRYFWILAAVLCGACASRPPEDIRGEVPETLTVSLAALKSLYAGSPYRIERSLLIKCYVTANDRHGAFYRTLVVADSSAGMEIKIASDRLADDYWIGDMLTVSCNGLVLGSYGGTVSLGGVPTDGYENGFIPASEFASRAVKDGYLPEAPHPETVAASRLTPSLISRLVRFDSLSVAPQDAERCWASEGYAAERRFLDLRGDTVRVRTLLGADYAAARIPAGRCRLTGILGYFAGKYSLTLRGYTDVYTYD